MSKKPLIALLALAAAAGGYLWWTGRSGGGGSAAPGAAAPASGAASGAGRGGPQTVTVFLDEKVTLDVEHVQMPDVPTEPESEAGVPNTEDLFKDDGAPVNPPASKP